MTVPIRPCSIAGCEKPQRSRQLCSMHHSRLLRRGATDAPVKPTVEQRFWSYVDKKGPTPTGRDELGACWLWTGGIDYGYGVFNREGHRKQSAHRYSFELAFGVVGEGLQVDHVCHDPSECTPGPHCLHRRCVNPSHLEAVTPRENTLRGGSVTAQNARKQECSRGHSFDEANTLHRNGDRVCRACQKEFQRTYRRRRRAKAKANRQNSST